MKSLHERLDPQKDAVLHITDIFGPFRAMQVFEVKDYKCFRDWLEEATGDEKFGLNHKIRLNGGETLGDQVVAAFVRTVLDLKADNQRLRDENEYLKAQLSVAKEKEQLEASAVLQVCQE